MRFISLSKAALTAACPIMAPFRRRRLSYIENLVLGKLWGVPALTEPVGLRIAARLCPHVRALKGPLGLGRSRVRDVVLL